MPMLIFCIQQSPLITRLYKFRGYFGIDKRIMIELFCTLLFLIFPLVNCLYNYFFFCSYYRDVQVDTPRMRFRVDMVKEQMPSDVLLVNRKKTKIIVLYYIIYYMIILLHADTSLLHAEESLNITF